MARLRQRNALGQCQSSGLWPSEAVQATASCPPPSIGPPVTVNLPAGAYYGVTTAAATATAQAAAEAQAESELECIVPPVYEHYLIRRKNLDGLTISCLMGDEALAAHFLTDYTKDCLVTMKLASSGGVPELPDMSMTMTAEESSGLFEFSGSAPVIADPEADPIIYTSEFVYRFGIQVGVACTVSIEFFVNVTSAPLSGGINFSAYAEIIDVGLIDSDSASSAGAGETTFAGTLQLTLPGAGIYDIYGAGGKADAIVTDVLSFTASVTATAAFTNTRASSCYYTGVGEETDTLDCELD